MSDGTDGLWTCLNEPKPDSWIQNTTKIKPRALTFTEDTNTLPK